MPSPSPRCPPPPPSYTPFFSFLFPFFSLRCFFFSPISFPFDAPYYSSLPLLHPPFLAALPFSHLLLQPLLSPSSTVFLTVFSLRARTGSTDTRSFLFHPLSLSLFEHRSSHLLHSRDSPLLPREELTLPALARRPWPEFYRPTVCTYYQQPSASFTRPKDPVKRLRTRTEEHRHVFLFLRTQRRSLRGRKGHSPVFRTRNG